MVFWYSITKKMSAVRHVSTVYKFENNISFRIDAQPHIEGLQNPFIYPPGDGYDLLYPLKPGRINHCIYAFLS